MMDSSKSRKEFERNCYNAKVANIIENKQTTQWSYGLSNSPIALQTPYKYIEDRLLTDVNNKVILDYCCGVGVFSILPAIRGGFVYGIDISDKSIEVAKARAEFFGVSERTDFKVMDAENLGFDDNTFDIVISYGSLSFLELPKAFFELSRVVKKDGIVIVVDTLGHNPILNLNRRKYIKSGKRQKYHYDNIMTIDRIKSGYDYFDKLETKYFNLFTLLAIPFKNMKIEAAIVNCLKIFDCIFLRIPFFNLLAFKFVLIMSLPKSKS